MNSDNRFNSTDELEKEIAKSVEKLIDEETSVAKAFVDRDEASGEHIDYMGQTQTIPDVRDTAQQHGASGHNASHTQENSQKSSRQSNQKSSQSSSRQSNQNSSRKSSQSSSRKNNQKNRVMVMLIVGVLVIAAAIMLIVSLMLNNSRKNSYSYNYSAGMDCYNSGDYSGALTYWEKASKDNEGRKNVELKLRMYECYLAAGDNNKAVEILKDAISYDKYNEKALTLLAQYYADQKDGASLTELLRKYKGTDGEKYLKSFEVPVPTASEASGKFDRIVELELKSENAYKIYYTVDGSDVTTKSKEYTEPVRIEKGKTTLKAAAVNSIGTMSHELELTFDIDYKNPDAPAVTPATGTYTAGTRIEITNIPEGSKAYYTLDGKTPTRDSSEYTGEITMPEGNTVFSAVIINEFGLESSVTKRNYNVGVTTRYSFDEAIERLKVAMIAKNDLNSDGTSADGGQAKFTYYKKTSIANVEMYITFYDIIKNDVTTRQTYYFGIDVATGKCYKVYDQNGTLIATEY